MAREWNIDVELDEQRGGTLILTCPSCHRVHKKQFRQASAGTEIKCHCGLSYPIVGNGLVGLQGSLDGLQETVMALGRSFFHDLAFSADAGSLH